ncbi:MAG: hypothetical protein R3B99_23560 [Polyangiales bacterium]
MDPYGLELPGWTTRARLPSELSARAEGEVRERGLVLSDASPVPAGLLCPRVFGEGSENVGWIRLPRPVVNLWMVPALMAATGLEPRDVEALYYHQGHLGPEGVVHDGTLTYQTTGAAALQTLTRHDPALAPLVWNALPVVPPRLRPERGQEGRTPSRLYRKVLHHAEELRNKTRHGAAPVLLEDERGRLQAAVSDALTWGIAQALESFTAVPVDLVRRTTYFLFARVEGAPDDTNNSDRPGTLALWLSRIDETRRRLREAAVEVAGDPVRERKLGLVLEALGLHAERI